MAVDTRLIQDYLGHKSIAIEKSESGGMHATWKEMDNAKFRRRADQGRGDPRGSHPTIIVVLLQLTNYSGTVSNMTQLNLPMPSVTALAIIAVEVFVALAIALGVWTGRLRLHRHATPGVAPNLHYFRGR